MNPAFPAQLLLWLGQLPGMIICLTGVVLALVWWRRHPTVSLWAVAGFGCLLLSRAAYLGGAMIYPWLSAAMGLGRPDYQALTIVTNLLGSLMSAAGLGMLTLAVFVRRGASVRDGDARP